MNNPARLRLHLIVEYDAHPAFYDTSDPDEMAGIDYEQIGKIEPDPITAIASIWGASDDETVRYWIEPV